MKILVSACLLGCACRYDGGSKPCMAAIELAKNCTAIPVCPEIYGGLPTPRPPCEISHGRVINSLGMDCTAEYRKGALETLRIARLYGCKLALLKEKSPSCGSGRVYDGSFSGRLAHGFGVTAELLTEEGIEVFGESEIEKLSEKLKA